MDYYLHQVHRGVVSYARRAGWILDARAHHGMQSALPEGWTADGLLAFAGWQDVFGPALRASGLPMVNLSQLMPELGIPSVQLDHHAAGLAAAEHLIGRGFRHLAMVQFAPRSVTSNARMEGFASAARRAGRQFHPAVFPNHDRDHGLPRQLDWLRSEARRLPHPVGVFTESDQWAVELIHACQQAGLSVPDQVAVVGVDNDDLVVDVAPVAVSSVDNDLHGLGYRGAELLDRIMDGEPPPARPVLVPPVGVVQRQSTSILAVTDPEVAAALRFIHARFAEPLQVDDVVAQTGTSRRRLQDLFLAHVGRTIADEVRRCRLDLAKRLLRETGLKVTAVAERAGFGTAVQMTKVFTRDVGVGPAGYRREHANR